MNFLVVGLGSMGKRRVRCLKALGHEGIFGFDKRADRREEARAKHGIAVFADFHEALKTSKADALIISVPPDAHHEYMKLSLEHGLPFFVEASVVDTDMDKIIAIAKKKGTVAAPSSTLYFHPAIKIIKDAVQSGKLGKISNILLHSGQYLPDWHTYEAVSDFYVSNPATGGGREIVPFELTWFVDIFGLPKRVAGLFRKTIDIKGADKIDDTYNCLLDYGNFMATMTVDVVSRYATRRLTINGSEKQLVWTWDKNVVSLFDPAKNAWEEISYEMRGAADGYNSNIGENMYIEEVDCFIKTVRGEAKFPNTLEADHKVLKMLYAIEESDKESRVVKLEL